MSQMPTALVASARFDQQQNGPVPESSWGSTRTSDITSTKDMESRVEMIIWTTGFASQSKHCLQIVLIKGRTTDNNWTNVIQRSPLFFHFSLLKNSISDRVHDLLICRWYNKLRKFIFSLTPLTSLVLFYDCFFVRWTLNIGIGFGFAVTQNNLKLFYSRFNIIWHV